MRRAIGIMLLAGLVFYGLSGALLLAQNAVCNPFFNTKDLQHWSGDDPTLIAGPGNAAWGVEYYCARKNPGSPDNNGSMTQDVHLIAGYTYLFSANIAAIYICPG